MFNLGQNSSLKGSGHLILNVLRGFNIIGLLTVAAASWAMIVMTGMTNNFFFFDAASHFFNSTIAVFLVVSELGFFKNYFENTWPVLSPLYGLTWLGAFMLVMGCHILGNLNEKDLSAEEIGLPIWRLILAAGILSITFGVFNIVSSIIFRDRKNGITARAVRSDGSLASAKTLDSLSYTTRSNSVRDEKPTKRWTKRFTFTGARKPKISKPIPQDVESAGSPDWQRDRTSPIMPEIRRPNTALHPMNTGVSRYSEASHLPRF